MIKQYFDKQGEKHSLGGARPKTKLFSQVYRKLQNLNVILILNLNLVD